MCQKTKPNFFIIIINITPSEFLPPALAGGLLLEWQQISSDLQVFSHYSGRSQ